MVGRILPFDELLSQHLNKLEKLKSTKKTGKRKRRGQNNNTSKIDDEEIFDSEEETKLILRALNKYNTMPVISSNMISELDRVEFYRQKYAAENALDNPDQQEIKYDI